MIKLDINNGNLEFDGIYIEHKITIDRLMLQYPKVNFELWVDNNQYKTYRLNLSLEHILLIKSNNGLVYNLEIYCKKNGIFKSSVKNTLARIGGEGVYPWGKVQVNLDNKAGYKSILIIYND